MIVERYRSSAPPSAAAIPVWIENADMMRSGEAEFHAAHTRWHTINVQPQSERHS